MIKVVVIGAGIGGLTTAALLAKAGCDVQVIESHIYPGGCAGTFYHQGYRFDAGATLAGGFYPGGPMDRLAKAVGISAWPAHPSDPSMVVHLPGGKSVTRYSDARRDQEHRAAFGESGWSFFEWQEKTADALWALALQSPPWPAQSLDQWLNLGKTGLSWLFGDLRRLNPSLLADAFLPVSAHLHNSSQDLRQFIDAQLLISAQTTSAYANALYGASALDLPRRGVAHLEGGMGAIAETLAQAVRDNGGKIAYRKEAGKILYENNRPVGVELTRGGSLPADLVVANLTPWNIASLAGEHAPPRLKQLPPRPERGWGAFMLYVGIDQAVVPPDFPLHHQVVVQEPLGEGNSVFLSLSPAWDARRAPDGRRALTISTHTDFNPWWDLYNQDREAYEKRKQDYARRLLVAAERALPGLQMASDLVLPGTPLSFERFTQRHWGWVGGFPQTSLFTAWAPRLAPGLWMVGDSIFPGQSTAAVALGGMRVARDILSAPELKRKRIAGVKKLSVGM